MHWMTPGDLEDLVFDLVARPIGSLIGLDRGRFGNPLNLRAALRLLRLERYRDGYEPDNRSRVQRWLDRIWEAHQMRKARNFDWFGQRRRLRRAARGR